LSNEYKEFNYPEKSFSFTIQERKLGRKELEKMGIGEDSWYVCIFARDEIYSNTVSGDTDNSCTDHRNGDIDTYISAAKYIVDRGGYVIRMGHLVSKDFGYKHEKVVDYATCCRTDFMDVYLAAHCKFFLGTASGGADLAHIFNTPFVGVNWVELGTSPIKKNEIFIPKHIRYINNHEDVPFNIQIDKFRYMPTVFGVAPEGVMSREGMEFSANTSEEILEITKEMFARVEQKWSYDKEYSDKFESYLRILDNHNHWFYKAATKSTIGDSFLKNMKLY
jgi:putative glycosyltransferase (TIGR04372 family)